MFTLQPTTPDLPASLTRSSSQIAFFWAEALAVSGLIITAVKYLKVPRKRTACVGCLLAFGTRLNVLLDAVGLQRRQRFPSTHSPPVHRMRPRPKAAA